MPRDSAPVELLAGYWTAAGDVRPGTSRVVSPWPLSERVIASARAGFSGVGLRHEDLAVVDAASGWSELRRLLARERISTVEIEYLDGWWHERSQPEVRARRRLLMRAAAETGARHVKLGLGGRAFGPVGRDVLIETLAELAAEAESIGTRLAVEPTAYSLMPDLAEVRDVLVEVGSDSVGLMLDVWHIYRAGVAFDRLPDLVPRDLVIAVELSDGPRECVGTLFDDTFDRRLLCGDGEFGVAAFIRAVRDLGYAGPYGVEIMSVARRTQPIGEALVEAFETTRDVLVAAMG